MFRFSRGFRGADFGTLGAQDGGGQTNSGGERQRDIDAETEKGDKKEGGGFLSEVMPLAKAGIDLAQSAGLCGCANKDKKAEDNKKAELARKYPFRDCGTDPNAMGFNSCVKFNERQQSYQDKDFADWQISQDADTSSKMSANDKTKFAAISLLAKKLRSMHPEAGSMTISQIRKMYPDDFDRVYAEVQKAYPFLKALDADTALAMAPGVSDMKLDDLIKKLDTMAAPAKPATAGGGLSMILIAGAFLGTIAAIKYKRGR